VITGYTGAQARRGIGRAVWSGACWGMGGLSRTSTRSALALTNPPSFPTFFRQCLGYVAGGIRAIDGRPHKGQDVQHRAARGDKVGWGGLGGGGLTYFAWKHGGSVSIISFLRCLFTLLIRNMHDLLGYWGPILGRA